jgi:steroid 5-alpha reductase family enzyme
MTYSLTFLTILFYGFNHSEQNICDVAVATLITIWAIRLGGYLLKRIHTIQKDDRFDDIRTNPISFMGFWVIQAVTCFTLSIPAILIFSDSYNTVSPLIYMGWSVALIGLFIETIADFQKFYFKRKHPDQFMNSGIWKHIMHPNYSGEILFWIGIAIAALPSQYGWLGLISPLWISFILIKFSGIPILHKKWESKYGDDPKYQKYAKESWKLFPFIY